MNIKNRNLIGGLLTIYKAKMNRLVNKPIKPKVIAYSVTWRCNAKCPMCGLSTMDNCLKDIHQELTADEIGNAFHDKNLDSLDLIRFTGGEPFLKDDFTQIVHNIWKSARPKLFYITTNGTFTDRINDFVRFFKDKDIKLNIQISLDATDETHDRIRGVPGLANKAINTLEMLALLKKSSSLNIGINQTIIKDNIKDIDPVNKLAQKMGIEHKVYLAVNNHESRILSCEEKCFELNLASHYTEDEKKQLYEKIENVLEAGFNFKGVTDINYIWHLVEKHLLKEQRKRILKETNPANLPCLAGFLYFRLMPNGNVMPCTMIPDTLGNIKEKAFSDIWFSDKADFIRRQIKNCPGCWVECDIVANFVYSDYILFSFLKNTWKTIKKAV